MPQNSFRNIGLRRDKNFSDLENKKDGLTNLLNDFASGTDTYIGDDLTQAIQSIRSYPVTKTEINNLAGITFKNTVYDNVAGASVTAPAVPLVTVKNQFDRVKLELGEESYFAGNTAGLTASFFNSSQIATNTVSLDTTTVFTGSPVLQKPFWLNGEFNFPNKFNSTLNNQQGGVQWDGFISPEADGDINFQFTTSCYTLVESAGEKIAHLGNGIATIGVTCTGSEYRLNNFDDHIYIAENTVIEIPGQPTRKIKAISLNITSSICTFTTDGPSTVNGSFSATPYTRYQSWEESNNKYYAYITDDTSYPDVSPNYAVNQLFNEPGVTTYKIFSATRNNLKYNPVQFSTSIWLPTGHAASTKTFNVSATMVVNTIFNNAFYSFSDTIPSTDSANFPEFKKFFENRLLQDGGKIGSAASPQSILTNRTINAVEFVPPEWSSIINQGIAGVQVGVSSGSKILVQTDVNASLAYAEVGNVIFKTGVGLPNDQTKIVKVLPGRGVIVQDQFNLPDLFNLNVINHRGLVKIVPSIWSYISTTVTVDSTSGLVPGMIFVYNGGKTEITKINNATSFEVGQPIADANAINDFSYVYRDAGILNYTTYNVATVTDTSTLILDTVFGIEPGYYIKSIGKAGTEHLQEIATVDTLTNTITTVSPTTGDISPGDKIIAERANINTAPPFVATLTGLSTNGSSIKLTNVNGIVRALDIEVKNYIDVNTEFSASSDSNYYRLVDITINDSQTQTSTPYKIIATSFSNPEP